jgi:hypothetical protein
LTKFVGMSCVFRAVQVYIQFVTLAVQQQNKKRINIITTFNYQLWW